MRTFDREQRTSDHIPPRLDLPVPRVEVVYECPERTGHFAAMWYHRLVLRHLEGFLYCLDIGTTGTTDADPLRYYQHVGDRKIMGPWRSGVQAAWDARHLGIPAFLVVGDKAAEEPAYEAVRYQAITAEPPRLMEDEEEDEGS